jgi:hypothetical protein
VDQLEILRERLYEMIKLGDVNGILKVSQELDSLVLKYMEKKLNYKRKLA